MAKKLPTVNEKLRELYQSCQTVEDGLEKVFVGGFQRVDAPLPAKLTMSIEGAWDRTALVLAEGAKREELDQIWWDEANYNGALDDLLRSLANEDGTGLRSPSREQFIKFQSLKAINESELPQDAWTAVAMLGCWTEQLRGHTHCLTTDADRQEEPDQDTVLAVLDTLPREERSVLLSDGMTTNGAKRWFGKLYRELTEQTRQDVGLFALVHSHLSADHYKLAERALITWPAEKLDEKLRGDSCPAYHGYPSDTHEDPIEQRREAGRLMGRRHLAELCNKMGLIPPYPLAVDTKPKTPSP